MKSKKRSIAAGQIRVLVFACAPLSAKASAWLLLSLLFGLPHLAAQLHHVHHYGDSDGLAGNKVYTMVQSGDGRMWFSTNNGIVSFDGRDWNEVGLKNESLGQLLALDDRQRLWAVSMNPLASGVSVLDETGWSEPIRWRNRRTFSLLTLTGQPSKALVGYEDGLALIDVDQRTSTPVELRQSERQPKVFSLQRYRDRIYAGTSLGLMFVDLSGNDLELVPVEIGCSDSIKGLAVDSDSERMWLVGSDWIGQFDGEQFNKIDAGFDDSICKSEFTICTEAIHGGQLIFGSWKSLFRYVPGEGITKFGNANGLLAEGANDLMLDQSGLLWVASVRGVSKVVSFAFSNYAQSNGLYNSEVSAVLERADGSFVLGHVGGITFFRDRPIKTVELGQGTNSRVHDLAEDQSGNLWVAAYEHGLVQIKSDGQIVKIPAQADRHDQIVSVLIDGNDQLWVGANSGLKKRDGEKFLDVPYPISAHQPGIRKLFLDRQNRLIVAPYNRGLLRYDNGNWDYWTSTPGSLTNNVFAFLDRKNGQRLVGTAGGLCILEDDKIVKLEHPRIDRPVYFIIEDQEQRIWCGTDKGVFRLEGETTEHFDVEHGLSGRETNRDAGHIDKKGRVWIGTWNGLSIYHPELDPGISNPPKLKFLQIKSGKEIWRPGQIRSLPFNRNALTFNFQAPSFYDESRIQVQSWMEGLENEWQDPVRPLDWAIHYNFLPPGKYRLHLRAANAYGQWSDVVSTEAIHIHPPFWNTWWFYSLVFVGVAAIGVSFHRYSNQRRRRYTARLEREVIARISELQQFELRYGVALSCIADGVMTTDMDGGVLFMNPSAEQIAGRRIADVGRPTFSNIFVWQNVSKNDVNELMNHLAKGKNWTCDRPLELAVPNGAFRLVEASTSPLRNAKHELLGAVIAIRDVTEKTRLQKELVNSQKLASLGNLAGGIAHDFNNLLSVVIWNIAILREELPESFIQEPLDLIDTTVLQARSLTKQLLTFAKGGAPLFETTYLDTLIRDAVSIIPPESNSRCELTLANDLLPVEIDVGQFNQVLNNLLVNAVQSMPAGGLIRVSANNRVDQKSANQQIVEIEIQDTGIGIPPDQIDRVFEPYFTTKKDGSGIGLATAYSIVQQHAGKLTVRSEMGIGTSFRISLPVSNRIPTNEKTSNRPSEYAPTGRILIVDDNEEVRETMGAMLSFVGFEVLTVSDGYDAIKVFEQEFSQGRYFHAVMLDLTIPNGLGGRETIQELLKIDPEVNGVVISGYSDDPVLSDYKSYGFKARLSKPCTCKEMISALSELPNASALTTLEFR